MSTHNNNSDINLKNIYFIKHDCKIFVLSFVRFKFKKNN